MARISAKMAEKVTMAKGSSRTEVRVGEQSPPLPP
jgi:hypothetical protein